MVSRADQEVQPKLAPTMHRLRQMFHIPLFEGELASVCTCSWSASPPQCSTFVELVAIYDPPGYTIGCTTYVECESSTSPIIIWKLPAVDLLLLLSTVSITI